jgi:hypothetical protein
MIQAAGKACLTDHVENDYTTGNENELYQFMSSVVGKIVVLYNYIFLWLSKALDRQAVFILI